MDARGEQGLRLGAAGERGDVDHLQLPPPQGVHIAHELERKADAGPATDATAPGRRQPLHFAGRQVEEVHDRARDPEQGPQPLQGRLGDLHGRRRGDDRPVDLVQDAEPLGVLGERRLAPLQLRHVGRHDQRRAPPGKDHGVRDDVHVDHPAVLQPMPPRTRVPSGLVGHRGQRRHDVLEPVHVLGGPDVADPHAEKLLP